jgi:hypothetical protein
MTITAWLFAFILATLFLTIVGIIVRGNGSRTWLSAQFDWFKGFFEETAGQPNKPSHKNLVMLIGAWAFFVSFMRVVVATKATIIPDMPANWLTFFLVGLGIRAAQSVMETRARESSPNGGSSPT